MLLLGCAALIALVTSAAVRDDKITKSEVDVRREYILTAKKPGGKYRTLSSQVGSHHNEKEEHKAVGSTMQQDVYPSLRRFRSRGLGL